MGDDKSGIEREEKLRVAILDEDYDGVNEYLNISDINKPSTHLGCEFQEISDDPTRIWADMSFYGFDDRTKKVYLLRCSEDEYGPVIPWTPVQFAAAAGRSGMTYHLLKLGADPRIKDKFGDDALSIARDLGRTVTPVPVTEQISINSSSSTQSHVPANQHIEPSKMDKTQEMNTPKDKYSEYKSLLEAESNQTNVELENDDYHYPDEQPSPLGDLALSSLGSERKHVNAHKEHIQILNRISQMKRWR